MGGQRVAIVNNLVQRALGDKWYDQGSLVFVRGRGTDNYSTVVDALNSPMLDICTGTAWTGITTTSGFSIYRPTTAIAPDVSSSSTSDDVGGTGISAIRIIGLDNDYTRVMQDMTLNGTSVVTPDQTFLRIHEAFAITTGSSGQAEGNVSINVAGQRPMALIPQRNNEAFCGLYTVPAGKKAVLASVTFGSGGESSGSVGYGGVYANVTIGINGLLVRNENGPMVGVLTLTEKAGMSESGFPLVFPEKVDVVCRGTRLSSNQQYFSWNAVFIEVDA